MRLRSLACAVLLMLSARAHANDSAWHVQIIAGVGVHSQAVPGSDMATVARALQRAVSDLHARDSMELCASPAVFIHPDLESFQSATGSAWFHLAVADRAECRIDLQRLPVVRQHGGIERSLRHELFHLAQPAGWERWRTEGEAQRFAGEFPPFPPLDALTPRQLDVLLVTPGDQMTHQRAMATALLWVTQGR